MMKTMEKPIEETTKEDFLSQLQKDAEIARKPIRGWLKNPQRRKRRDSPITLTDWQVMELLRKIDALKEYTKLNREVNTLIKTRDKALISLAWIFFKGAGENLRLKREDVFYDERELVATFRISKKAKTIKPCPSCAEINATKAIYCKKCGQRILDEPTKKIGREKIRTKRKVI